jgi:hypothetical protein
MLKSRVASLATRKADCQSCKGNYQADFHCFLSIIIVVAKMISCWEAGERDHIPRLNRWFPWLCRRAPCSTEDIVSTSSSAENFRGSFKKI